MRRFGRLAQRWHSPVVLAQAWQRGAGSLRSSRGSAAMCRARHSRSLPLQRFPRRYSMRIDLARRLRIAAALVLFSAIVASSVPSAFAQTITGTISGTVTGQENMKLAGVAVTALAPSGRYNATTDQNGFYSINGVTPDTYAVT